MRLLQGIRYVPLMNEFADAAKVIDRKEPCIERVLKHYGKVISEVNRKLG